VPKWQLNSISWRHNGTTPVSSHFESGVETDSVHAETSR
jgi:hypothetical protein